jgi:outer membrane protein
VASIAARTTATPAPPMIAQSSHAGKLAPAILITGSHEVSTKAAAVASANPMPNWWCFTIFSTGQIVTKQGNRRNQLIERGAGGIMERSRPNRILFTTIPCDGNLRSLCEPARARAFGMSVLTMSILTTTILTLFAGCAAITPTPELNPDRYVAKAVDHPWQPPRDAPSYEPQTTTAQLLPPPVQRDDRNAPYTLAELIDLALTHNPATRAAWAQARVDAAAWAVTRAKYYPKVSTETDLEYSRMLFQIPGASGRVKTAQIVPLIQLTYTLLDFGRRRADSAQAFAQLAAANFVFNRRMQEVVFDTQRFFYGLAAAKASREAARQNLELARADDDAVAKRVELGLATQPALLLSRQQVAQAEYDVANAELFVQEAQSNLALALGIPANVAIDVSGLDRQALPAMLDGQIDKLIQTAITSRPDLAADLALVRASESGIDRAHAEFLPQADVLGNYGEQNWRYTFNAGPTIGANMPQYTALLTLKWDIFTGFERVNALREAEAQRDVSAANLRSLELATIAQVWRAYYEFQTSRKRYEYAIALLRASQESYDALLDTYRQGLSTIVELLTAERDLANARYTMIQSTADLLTASAATAFATGAVQPARP